MQTLEKGAEVGITWGLRMVEGGVYARESTSAYQKQRERERERDAGGVLGWKKE